jgi:ABC-2 type transport system ATP-binding protein
VVAEFDAVGKVYSGGAPWKPRLRAVDGVSFAVEAGEVFGLVGPNRAGKTTLVKILLSLCRPSAGRAKRLGRPVTDRRTLGRIGYMHESHAFPRYLNAAALLEFYGALTLLPQPVVRRRVPELLETVGLADRSREPIARFSKGMVQRLGLAQALVNDPELLVLDEPTEGLDMAGRALLRQVVADLRGRGRTVLLVSHALEEVEHLCDRIAVLVNGRLVQVGRVDDLTRDPATGTARPLGDVLQSYYETSPS